MSIAINNKENTDIKKIISSKKQFLWIAMGSMVMFFGGLLSALIIEKADLNNWQAFVLPSSFTYSTVVIVLSSLLFFFYKMLLKKKKSVFWLLFSIFICGIGFTFLQIQGWQYLLDQEIKFVGPKWNKGGGFLYVLTLMHMLHLFGGMIAMLVTMFKAKRGSYTMKNFLGLELASSYWHFLTLLWLVIFFFLKSYMTG
tara:strand:- start:28443 stop:29036 length:594 start_codon:yes stop_codon:yes gene_type:complete